jgi:hypothetical protein
MFPPIPGALFWRDDFPTFSQQLLREAVSQARGLTAKDVKNANDAIDKIVEVLRLEPVTVHSDTAKFSISDVSRRGSQGESSTLTVSFTGTSALIHVRPNPHGLNPPHGEVAGNTISVVLDEGPRHASIETLQERRDHWLGELHKCADPLRANVEALNEQLRSAVEQAVGERINELQRRTETERELNQ